MGNEESGMLEEGDEVGSLPRGGRRGAGGKSTGDNSTGGSLNTNSDYGDYSASSSSNTRRRGGRRGNASSSNKDNSYSSGVSADKFKTPSSVTTGADDMFSDLDLPMGETPKSISNKGRKAFNQAIWSPRGDNSKPPKGFQGNSNSGSLNVVPKQSKKKTEKKKAQETTADPKAEPEKPAFNFDSLYFNQSKPSSQKVAKSEVDDDLFSDPFGVSSGSGPAKESKSRSINVDVKMGNQKLKDKVRGDRRRKEQQRAKNTFHKPNADVMFDAFDDLEEEMIGEGVIGNGNKKSGDRMTKRSSVAKPKELQWNTSNGSGGGSSGYGNGRGSHDSSSSRNRGRDMGGNDDGWF